ncbi:hypothetical protein BC829DRAFT_446021 [Chytridium lagenaria]|nr:hypothetical protein BC829DRAFT_446021 [Chytridium lagenaria]
MSSGALQIAEKLSISARMNNPTMKATPLMQVVIFQFFAAALVLLPKHRPSHVLTINTIVKVVEDETRKDNESAKVSGREVLDMIHKMVGTNDFVSILNEVKSSLSGVREERRSKRKIHAVLDPELHAKRKIRKNELKKESKKRKSAAKLSFLEGERRGMENLKTDLMRRVKMLEFALRQERGKLLSSQATASIDIQARPELNEASPGSESLPPVPGSVQQKVASSSSAVDTTSGDLQKANKLTATAAATAPATGGTLLGFSKGVGNLRRAGNGRVMSPSCEEAVVEPSPEQHENMKARGGYKGKEPAVVSNDSGNYLDDIECTAKHSTDERAIPRHMDGNMAQLLDEPEPSTRRKSATNSIIADAPMWKPKVSLSSHLDCIRTVSFLPKDLALITGSEDGTAKLWNLKSLQGPVTSAAISPDSQYLFTGSLDSTVLCWKIPPVGSETYGEYDQSSLLSTASADSTVKIWDISGTTTTLNQLFIQTASPWVGRCDNILSRSAETNINRLVETPKS